ncbi:trypsin-like peptidase domain-containing protein [Streptomyces sp. H27-H1]|uniref:S1C family serine protease n=1 Tax=Streptomyces sp. H27-H1 TaxID=2996461 RepID=UPI002270ED46|nr:trypsin-like peptidase domain-containing protein [Streptomyces sp. H27-H1]MCY0931627.1 trypsin-like peptidase domain-containing protein [Streptomyces sp. H27-H1]
MGVALLAGAVGGLIGSRAPGLGTTVVFRSTGQTMTLGTAGPQAAGPVPGVAAEALRSTVTIEVNRPGVRAVGTGFFFDSAGHVLTNAHVVAPDGKAGKLTVTFADGSSSPASVVGVATGYDIAVVKLDGPHRPGAPLPLGDSNGAVVGEPVVAAGAPFDLAGTITSGILSAVDRPVTTRNGTAAAYLNALQTDAPINPGNSGGPLLDDAGRVIGVNSAISTAATPEGAEPGNVGLGFAIPVNQAKWVAESILEHGKAQYAQLGFTVSGKYDGKGVQIMPEPSKEASRSLVLGGPAEKAGLRPGDVITGLDGRAIANGPALMSAVWSHHPHDRAEVQFVRDGRTRSVTVVLGERSGDA